MIAKSPIVEVEPLSSLMIEPAVRAALLEDFGRAGDLTTEATVKAGTKAHAIISAREPGRIAGLDFALRAFRLLDHKIMVTVQAPDGSDVVRGDIVATVEGLARPILTAERVALNFLGQLSGVATATAKLVKLVEGTKARVVCTRKTTPGMRAFEKYAVRCGGGRNHRFGLDDGILIKDNHIVAAGGIRQAILAARAHAGHMVHIEVEVDSLKQLEEALALNANAVLLDNMTPAQLREAVKLANGRAMLEASGNVTADSIAAIAATGVDLISSGAITHSSKCLDLGLDFKAA
ncbi:MAG: carboxylating nicotinate-nucleotide diphosphorylase [Alphaproteobacteria bacterium]|nr:carboxylating nicotinate-nucleotide diphosphorylase [Alphaproteobacteria bacterium]